MRLLATVTALVFLAACAPSPEMAGGSPERQVNARSCARQGGAIRRVGMSQSPACVIPHADAGRRCTDGSQCAGRCLLNRDDPANDAQLSVPPGQSVGRCEASNITFGCLATVDNGQVSATICVD